MRKAFMQTACHMQSATCICLLCFSASLGCPQSVEIVCKGCQMIEEAFCLVTIQNIAVCQGGRWHLCCADPALEPAAIAAEACGPSPKDLVPRDCMMRWRRLSVVMVRAPAPLMWPSRSPTAFCMVNKLSQKMPGLAQQMSELLDTILSKAAADFHAL